MRTKAIKIRESEVYKGSSAKEWRDLYGFSIVRKEDSHKLSLTHYNKKVSALQLNLLPGYSCPGSTKMCRAKGYCHKVEYENVLQAFKENTETARNNEVFKRLFISALVEYSKNGGKWFRFHSYGDIFSQYYLDSIFELAGLFSEVKFLAHTKSYWLDYSQKPDNFSVYFSIFPDSKEEIESCNNWNFPYSLAGSATDYSGSRKRRALRALTCPAGCKDCRICWESPKTVRFNWH